MSQLHTTTPLMLDPVELDINDAFDRLIRLLNARRAELLDLVREKRVVDILREKIIKQLTEVQEELHKVLS